MSGARHTAGPWEFGAPDCDDGYLPSDMAPFRVSGDGWVIASVLGDVAAIPAEANARLIAAAPDLLAALRAAELDILALLSSARLTPEEAARDDVVRQVRAAIAKAEGRT